MTRRDFVALARLVYELKRDYDSLVPVGAIQTRMADLLEQEGNKNFDRAKFLVATVKGK